MPPPSPAARDPDDWWWVFDPRQSLRARAVLIFGGLALAFSLLAAGLAETLFRRHLTRQLGASFENLAFQIGDKLDRALDERLRTLQLGASVAALRSPAATVMERRAVLDNLLNAAPDCAWIGFADPEGRVIAAAPTWFENSSVSNRDWFRGARRTAFVGSVHDDPELARELSNPGGETPRFLDLAVPVSDARGNPIGVLGAQLNWAWARDTQHSVVSDAARSEHISVALYAAAGDVLLDTSGSNWTRPPDPPAVGQKAGARGHLSESIPGEGAFLTGYARTKGFRDFRGANWLVTVRQPEVDALAPARDLRRTLTWMGASLTFIIVVMSWVVAGRITRRMAAVATAAVRIRQGDVLTLMPRPSGDGELQSMCGALGDMVDDFRQKQDQLESENQRHAARAAGRTDQTRI
jgi:HAMP domain-containing protein